MKIYLQWATRPARDYQLRDSSEWVTLPFKADAQRSTPIPTNQLDGANGWVADLAVQGVSFSCDHYHVRDLTDGSGGIIVTCWDDNPTLSPPGSRIGRVWTILPLAPDERFGGALNTVQSQVRYVETVIPPQETWPEHTTFAPWSEFVANVLPAVITDARHGIWVTDAHWETLLGARTQHGWHEWAL